MNIRRAEIYWLELDRSITGQRALASLLQWRDYQFVIRFCSYLCSVNTCLPVIGIYFLHFDKYLYNSLFYVWRKPTFWNRNNLNKGLSMWFSSIGIRMRGKHIGPNMSCCRLHVNSYHQKSIPSPPNNPHGRREPFVTIYLMKINFCCSFFLIMTINWQSSKQAMQQCK
jgi:hypothetical protein